MGNDGDGQEGIGDHVDKYDVGEDLDIEEEGGGDDVVQDDDRIKAARVVGNPSLVQGQIPKAKGTCTKRGLEAGDREAGSDRLKKKAYPSHPCETAGRVRQKTLCALDGFAALTNFQNSKDASTSKPAT